MTKRVLLAEDEPGIVESLSFVFGRAGFDVRVETDGRAALAAARAEPPDVVVLDVMMPGMDGYEVLRELRTDPATRALPVLVLTAKGQRQDRETAKQAGADAFITKPFSNADVVAAVTRLAG